MTPEKHHKIHGLTGAAATIAMGKRAQKRFKEEQRKQEEESEKLK